MSKKINKADLEVIINEKMKEDIKYFNTLLNRIVLFHRGTVALHEYRDKTYGIPAEFYKEMHGGLLELYIAFFYLDIDRPIVLVDKDGNLNQDIEGLISEMNLASSSKGIEAIKDYELTFEEAGELCILIAKHMHNINIFSDFICRTFKDLKSYEK